MKADRPIQVYLEERQDRALRRIARERGTTLTELVRESLDLWLRARPAEKDPAWQIVGLGASDTDDLGRAHDEHLAAALGTESEN
jgi:hypothetical protein